jgi:hypothetical protein
MKFRSDYERKKWAALQSSSNASIKSIVSGKGTSADVQRVSNTLGQMSKLSQQVFDEGVEAVADAAKEAVKALNERRVSKGKAPLTADAFGKLFEDAFARQMKKEVPPLLQDIHDTLLIELYEQDDRFRSTLANQFDRFKEHMASGDVPSTDDMIALFDLNREITFKQEDILWKQREEGLLEKIADTFKDTLREVAAAVQASRQRTGGGSPFGARSSRLAIEGPKGGWEVVDVDPKTHEAVNDLKALNDMSAGSTPAAESSGLLSVVKHHVPLLGGPKAAAASGALAESGSTLPMVSLSEKADAAIITAAEQQTAFHERIADALDQNERDKQDDEEDKDEEQTNWFRKLRSYIGDKYKAATGSSNWWEAAAKTLLLAMTDPGLFDAISKKVSEILTWDNINKVLHSTIEWVWQKGNDMVEWVLGKIGLGTPKATDNVDSSRVDGGPGASLPMTPAARLAAANAQPDPFKKGGTGGPTPENTDPNAHSSWQSSVNNFLSKNFGFRMDKSDAVNIGGATGDTLNMGGTTMPVSTAMDASTNPVNISNVSKTTSVQQGQPITYKTVPATQAPPAAGAASGQSSTRGRAPSPSSQIGLNSIPTTSGINDALAITNLGLMM